MGVSADYSMSLTAEMRKGCRQGRQYRVNKLWKKTQNQDEENSDSYQDIL